MAARAAWLPIPGPAEFEDDRPYYDNDSYLDLFIADYADCIDGPLAQTGGAGGLKGLPTPRSHLYHNNGDGTFTDVTHLLGRR